MILWKKIENNIIIYEMLFLFFHMLNNTLWLLIHTKYKYYTWIIAKIINKSNNGISHISTSLLLASKNVSNDKQSNSLNTSHYFNNNILFLEFHLSN